MSINEELEKAIFLLKEATRVLEDCNKLHDSPDLGEPFDINANHIQFQCLMEIASTYVEKAKNHYGKNNGWLEVEFNRLYKNK